MREYLNPKSVCITDGVLRQAHKKVVAYLRGRNSYADQLALDDSLAGSTAFISLVRKCIENEKYRSSPMAAIPAPKTDEWKLSASAGRATWAPNEGAVARGLRPIAHLDLVDQVIATALMMCLADAIETAQGNPAKPFSIWNPIVNYGNRLDSSYSYSNGRQSASFRWGSARTYRKYFVDYRRFLDRPKELVPEIVGEGVAREHVFVVTLDIARFFDAIRIPHLVKVIKTTIAEQRRESDDAFWALCARCLRWSWRDPIDADIYDTNGSPDGLPQGLVAGGFFANAYLLPLDKELAGLKSKEIGGIRVHDTSRYVDDIRLVVSLTSSAQMGTLVEILTKFFGKLLQKHAPGLTLNAEKTTVIDAEHAVAESNTAEVMAVIKQKLSGPADDSELRDVLERSRSLLRNVAAPTNAMQALMSELVLPEDAADQAQKRDAFIKDSTVLRYTTGRMVQALRDRRQMAPIGTPEGLQPISQIDREFRLQAFSFLEMWTSDPSLHLLLGRALSLFPHPKLLAIVEQATLSCLAKGREKKAQYVGWFTLSFIFKTCATDLSLHDAESVPRNADLPAFHARVSALAFRVLDRADEFKGMKPPWYVKQQALLYLAVMGRAYSGKESRSEAAGHDEDLLAKYSALHQIANGRTPKHFDDKQALRLFIVAINALPATDIVFDCLGRWLRSLSATATVQEVQTAMGQLYLAHPLVMDVFFADTSFVSGLRVPRWIDEVVAYRAQIECPISAFNGKSIPLLLVASRPDNPFGQENVLLLFVRALLADKKILGDVGTHPLSLQVTAKDWNGLRPDDPRGLIVSKRHADYDDAFLVAIGKDWTKQIRLAALLRSAMLGQLDFTASQTRFAPKTKNHFYRGFAGDIEARRVGLTTEPAVVANSLSITSWMSGWLTRLLRWPGTFIPKSSESLSAIKKNVDTRLGRQSRIFGRASKLHIYDEPVRLPIEGTSMRVALVQTCRPLKQDFSGRSADLSDPAYRPVHRDHLVGVLSLLEKHLLLARRNTTEPLANMVVLPELSVHEQDLGLLKQLASRYNAIVLCGTVFRHNVRAAGPVNVAQWYYPTAKRGIREGFQGKHHLTKDEQKLGIRPYRPHQLILSVTNKHGDFIGNVSSAICFDASDVCLAADMRDLTDFFVVPALNKDVDTFDAMAAAYRFHLFQHIAIVNSGEFGGTLIQAPWKERHERVIVHNHGGNHVAITVTDLDMEVYARLAANKTVPDMKETPAGYKRHPQ